MAEHGIDALLKIQPGLRLAPSNDDSIRVAGRLRFHRIASGFEAIEDNYEIEISIPAAFPEEMPLVWETAGRIPADWHRNPGGTLCLASPTAVRLKTIQAGTIDKFVEELVEPYLYQRSYFEKHQEIPLGELDHGVKGVLKDFMDRFQIHGDSAAATMVYLTSLRKRVANKRSCPCGIGVPLGRCFHHWKVNKFREALGRKWFKEQFRQIEEWRRVEGGTSTNQPLNSRVK